MTDGKKSPAAGSDASAGSTPTIQELISSNEELTTRNAELNHRLKNMLAVVIGLAGSTLEHAPSHPAHAALIGRLRAMARAYGALAKVNWGQISLLDVLQGEIDQFDQHRFHLSGPDVPLGAQKALSLAFVFHELCTNAARHGALATPEGTVSVVWEKGDASLRIHWQENGGPVIETPAEMGFGLTLLQGEVTYRHGGSVEMEFDPAGLVMQIIVPEQR